MIDHTGVIVADLEKSKKCYSSALGAIRLVVPNYYGAFVFDPMATTSKRSAASRCEHSCATSDILTS